MHSPFNGMEEESVQPSVFTVTTSLINIIVLVEEHIGNRSGPLASS